MLNLEDISTHWSLLKDAGGDETWQTETARHALVLRYMHAIRRYVSAIVRDDDSADELTQEFAVRLLQGDFGNARLERGRFRDLLKTAIRNMARNRWKYEKLRACFATDPNTLPEDDSDDEWVKAWRQTLIDLTWEALAAWERRQEDSIGCTLLKLRVDNPDAAISDIQKRLHEKTDREYSAAAVRTQLHRARVRFTQLLIEEISRGLHKSTPELVDAELSVLRLKEYTRPMLSTN